MFSLDSSIAILGVISEMKHVDEMGRCDFLIMH
jgi:hypothetical protein